jgi:hypothetical protein
MPLNKLIVNVSGGEISALTYGRVDSPLYGKSVRKCENFIIQPQGGYRYRNGTAYVHTTRLNLPASMYEFQFNDQQAYVIEATPNWFRFYTQNGIVLNAAPFTISSYTTGAVTTFQTSAVHGMSAGAEVFIQGYAGNGWDTLLNGQFFPVTVIDTTHFSIVANSTGLSAPTTVGTITAIYEIATPYLAPDLPYLQLAQIANLAYVANNNYEPRQLTRSANSAWALNTYSRTSDPFPNGQSSISAITLANPGVITTSGAHGLSNGTQIFISGIVGTTQLNGNQYIAIVIDTTHFSLTDLSGNAINTSAFTAWASGGTIQPSVWPRAVAFTDSGRLMFAGTPQNPMTIWASAAPTTSATQYDVFTGGSLATSALSFTLAPVHGRIDTIEWITSTSQTMVLGCYGSIRTLYGSAIGQPITPSAINSLSINTFGAVNAKPVSNGYSLFYIQRGGLLLRSADYNTNVLTSNTFSSTDRNFVAEHLTTNGLKQCVESQGQPDLIWVVRFDGKFLGLTFNATENISGWARHYMGGSSVNTKGITVPFGKVLSMANMLRNQANSLFYGGDQIWFCVERVINGQTIRSVEYMTDAPVYPIRQDYNASILNTALLPAAQQAADDTLFGNALFESQKTMCHLDMSSVYDGSQLGLTAGASLTPSATSGLGITITSSAAIFTSSMINRQIWKQYDINGNGGGRATIKTVVSSTQVTADVISPFDNTNLMNAGNWYLTSTTISNLNYLNNTSVSVTADGSALGAFTVANGSITLPFPVTYCTVGLPYVGTLISMDLKGDDGNQPAEAIMRNMYKAAFNFINSGGVSFGTDVYKFQNQICFKKTNDVTDRPTPLFTGIIWQPFQDNYQDTIKTLVIVQANPLPCIITSMDAYIKTPNE